MKRRDGSDQCTCGSGKMFKDCCGRSNVIQFNPTFYNNELDRLQQELMDFASRTYEAELFDLYRDYFELYIFTKPDREAAEAYLVMVLNWAIFNEPIDQGQTIFEKYCQAEFRNIKNPTVKKTFSTWTNAIASVFKIVEIAEDGASFVVQDLSTNVIYECVHDQESTDQVGNLIIGVLLPYVNINTFFIATLSIAEENEDHVLDILDEIDDIDEDLDDIFPDFLAEAMGLQDDFFDELEWFDREHELVADLFVIHTKEKNYDAALIEVGLLFWNGYCLQNDPTIRKAEAHAAALDYLIQRTFKEDSTITQAQIAKEYGTTPGAVSNNFRNLDNEMEFLMDLVPLMDRDDE